MNKFLNSFFAIQIFAVTICFAQQKNFGSTMHDVDKESGECVNFLDNTGSLPNTSFISSFIRDNHIYFYISDQMTFDRFLPSQGFGLTVDIIQSDQLACGADNALNQAPHFDGFVMQPVYRDDLLPKIKKDKFNHLTIEFAKFPSNQSKELSELNVIVVEKNAMCYYRRNVSIPASAWEMLQTGFYKDSLSIDNQNKFGEISKNLKFVVPFKKGKSNVEPSDIQSMIDSLNFTDYDIKEITIHAYSSIEGPTEVNQRIQNKRAETIVRILQEFQTKGIISTIHASENWVEFLSDIVESPYKEFKDYSKNEIKEKLQDKKLLDKLEIYLKRHRKAVVKVSLKKKITLYESNQDQIKNLYDDLIATKNIEEALYLQGIIFDRIKNESLPSDFLDELSIPEQSIFGPLLNNKLGYYGDLRLRDDLQLLNAYERLAKILPDSYKIKYNILAMKMKVWSGSQMTMELDELWDDLKKLEMTPVPKNLLKRMYINYWIIATQYYYLERNIDQMQTALYAVMDSYEDVNHSDNDLVGLASYFSFYRYYELAREILAPRAVALDAKEDLIFYYIQQTISNNYQLQLDQYRAILYNALDKNKFRFCQLFENNNAGGVSFQLLRSEFLKQTFCDNCQWQDIR